MQHKQYQTGYPTIFHPAPTPWGLPLRCMISKDIKNLVFAGRNISVTHAALSSCRVMATCGILGQALGTAVAQALTDNVDIRCVDVMKLQQTLMKDDCFIPWHVRENSELTKKAACSAEVVRDGIDRGEEHLWKGKEGECIVYTFGEDVDVKKIYLTFDSDLNRDYHNMPCCYPLKETRYILPETLMKEYQIVGKDSAGNVYRLTEENSYQRFVTYEVDWKVCSVEFVPLKTHGCKEYRVFRFEVE